ncbi:MAG: DUF4390 domain-containing protein [Candidatus Omnitrophota bacterium]|nr:MAG: DUF4390 domain-containing protein [Candidatus Omnitrophota bacterium]
MLLFLKIRQKFFMIHIYQRSYKTGILIFIFMLLSKVCLSSEAFLKDIVVTTSKKDLLVYFTAQRCFTKEMEKAILNGVPVTFTYRILLDKKRSFWPDKGLRSLKLFHTIKYDQLKGVFIVTRSELPEQMATSKDFIWAKKLMTTVEVPVVPISALKKGDKYELRLKAELNKVKLPLYLHYIFFFTSLWDFETDWYYINFVY